MGSFYGHVSDEDLDDLTKSEEGRFQLILDYGADPRVCFAYRENSQAQVSEASYGERVHRRRHTKDQVKYAVCQQGDENADNEFHHVPNTNEPEKFNEGGPRQSDMDSQAVVDDDPHPAADRSRSMNKQEDSNQATCLRRDVDKVQDVDSPSQPVKASAAELQGTENDCSDSGFDSEDALFSVYLRQKRQTKKPEKWHTVAH